LHEWRIIAPIFIALTILSAALLTANLPKESILWLTFIASIVIPAFIFFWKERRNKIYHIVQSFHTVQSEKAEVKWPDDHYSRKPNFCIETHPNMHREQMRVKVAS